MQYYCPICDQKMKTAHWCSACHCYIKEPVFTEHSYKLNESDVKLNACLYDENNPEERKVLSKDRDYTESYGSAPDLRSKEDILQAVKGVRKVTKTSKTFNLGAVLIYIIFLLIVLISFLAGI